MDNDSFTKYAVYQTYEPFFEGVNGAKLTERRYSEEFLHKNDVDAPLILWGSRVPEKGDELGYSEEELHRVIVDIDQTVVVQPSKTEGHFHIAFPDMKPVPWKSYVKLLEAMEECGLLEEGYVSASKDRRDVEIPSAYASGGGVSVREDNYNNVDGFDIKFLGKEICNEGRGGWLGEN
jgi:hypothetical protein